MLVMNTAAAGGSTSMLKVVIADLPQMLADVVQGVLIAAGDFEVVSSAAPAAELPRLLDAERPVAVIVGHEDSVLPEIGRALMERDPSLTLLAIRADGQRAWIHRLAPVCEPVSELSPENLVQTLRTCTGLFARTVRELN